MRVDMGAEMRVWRGVDYSTTKRVAKLETHQGISNDPGNDCISRSIVCSMYSLLYDSVVLRQR